MPHQEKSIYKSHWFYLFHALILLLIIFPYLDPQRATDYPFAILAINSILMLTIIYAVSPNRRLLFIGVLIVFPALISFWSPEMVYKTEVILFSTALLYCYALVMTVNFLLKSKDFNLNQLFGATSVYILIGLAWTTFYQSIEYFFPGSFFSEEVHNLDNTLSWSDFLYFSFTTLTTLGYGDITAIAPGARSLAIIEAITGVIFIPVIISGIVSIIITHSIKEVVKETEQKIKG